MDAVLAQKWKATKNDLNDSSDFINWSVCDVIDTYPLAKVTKSNFQPEKLEKKWKFWGIIFSTAFFNFTSIWTEWGYSREVHSSLCLVDHRN